MIETKRISEILYYQGNKTVNNIVQNMMKPIAPFGRPRYASGRTATSLKVEADSESLSIIAPDYFEQLETGISPAQSRKRNVSALAKSLYGWSFDAEISIPDKKQRFSFAFNASKKQQEVGSILYRRGGQRDIYTTEVQPLLERITKSISNELINIQIVK